MIQQDVSISRIDLVTARRANLWAELLTQYDRVDPQLAPARPPPYATTIWSRRPRGGRLRPDAWFYPLVLGEPLPAVPVWLVPDRRVGLPLDRSYDETYRTLPFGWPALVLPRRAASMTG